MAIEAWKRSTGVACYPEWKKKRWELADGFLPLNHPLQFRQTKLTLGRLLPPRLVSCGRSLAHRKSLRFTSGKEQDPSWSSALFRFCGSLRFSNCGGVGGRFGGGGCPPFSPPVLPGWGGGGLGTFRMPKNPVGRAHPATRTLPTATPKPEEEGRGLLEGEAAGLGTGLRSYGNVSMPAHPVRVSSSPFIPRASCFHPGGERQGAVAETEAGKKLFFFK